MIQDAGSEGYATSDDESSSDSEESPAAAGSDDDIDMEDLGGRVASSTAASTSQPSPDQQDAAVPREMLTPALRANLSKQGYKLIGTAGTVAPVTPVLVSSAAAQISIVLERVLFMC